MKTKIYIVLVLLVIVAMIFGGIYLNKKSIDNAYNYAITLIQNGSYGGALLELEKANPNLLDRKEFKDDLKYQKLNDACQMCHDSCANIEKTELFNSPETELDPMHLCLCPNCATKYRKLRNDTTEMEYFKEWILSLTESEMVKNDYISFNFGDCELWFTQIHIAEIQFLIKLAADAQNKDLETPKVVEDEQEGLSVYSSYVGKKLKRKKDGFLGEVTEVNDNYLTVKVLNGTKTGEETKIQLSFIIQNPDIYQII